MPIKSQSMPTKTAVPPEWSTTAIHLPKATLQLLKVVAFHRSQTLGGRMSVSKLVAEVVESHRREFEQELRK
jgi:hypothetical protein